MGFHPEEAFDRSKAAMSDMQEQPTSAGNDEGLTIRLVIFAVVFVVAMVIALLLPPPLSTGLIILLSVGFAGYGVIGLRVQIGEGFNTVKHMRLRLPVPHFLSGVRNLLAAGFAIAGLALMTSAAMDFDPAHRQEFLNQGAGTMLLGALAIGIAVWFSNRQPELAQPIPQELSKPRRGWWIFAGAGVLVMLLLSEISGHFLDIEALRQTHINVEFGLLLVGTLLILYGFGGCPRITLSALRIQRGERLYVFAVVAIFLLGFGLRLWQQEDTMRVLIDELHWSDGIQRITGDPINTDLLFPMSGQSPYSNLFPYWQTAAVEIIGYTWTGFRFVSVVLGALTVLATYGLGRAIFDKNTALLGMLAMATFPPAIHFSRVAMALIGDPLFGTMAVMFVARALRRNHRIEWVAAGISLGFSQYFYEGGRLLFPALVIGWMLVLFVSGHLRGRIRGVVLMVIAFILIGGPIYYTIIGNDLPLFGRMDVSGDARINDELQSGITVADIVERVQHALTAFMIYGAHPDLSVYYGGEQALVNVAVLPLFLFGAFYLVWRFPAPAFLIPLWIIAVGSGNGLMRDTLVSARYYVVLPPLALAIMAGVRYFLPFLAGIVAPTRAIAPPPPLPPDDYVAPEGDQPPVEPPVLEQLAPPIPARPSLIWRLSWGIITIVSVVIAVYHVTYYFGPHLEIFNEQVRDSKPYRDGIDAGNRTIDLPGNTQVIIASSPEHDQNVPRHWLTFLSRDHGGDPSRYFPMLTYPVGTLSPRFLRDLTPGVNYAFFLSPTDQDAMRLIYRQFPDASPPDYSTAYIPANKEYIMIWVPA